MGLPAGSVGCGVPTGFDEPDINTLINTNVCVSRVLRDNMCVLVGVM
jgi:hypothetical protein